MPKRKAQTVPHDEGSDASAASVKRNKKIHRAPSTSLANKKNTNDKDSEGTTVEKNYDANRNDEKTEVQASKATTTSAEELALLAAESALEAALFGREQQHHKESKVRDKNKGSSSGDNNRTGNKSNHNSSKLRATKKEENDARKWQDFFFQLAVFKQRNGHVRFRRTAAGGGVAVAEGGRAAGAGAEGGRAAGAGAESSSSSSTLARWVVQQRAERKRDRLSEDQVAALDALGFIWDVVKDDSERTWEERYQELILYKEENNNTQVPLYYEGGLGRWCSRQRSGWKLRQQLQSGRLDKTEEPRAHQMIKDDQIEKLQKLGFRWELYKQDTWDARVEELAEYKMRFGHCNVPQHWPENKGLGKFVARQRYNYCLLKQGKMKCKSMTQERIDKLEAMGFDWGKFRPSTWTNPQTEESKQEKEESIEKLMESKRGGTAAAKPSSKDQAKRPRGRPRKDKGGGLPPQKRKQPVLDNATATTTLRQPGNEIIQQQQQQQQQQLPGINATQQHLRDGLHYPFPPVAGARHGF